MGVSSVWDQIKLGQDQRIPLRQFVTQFQKQHNRPLRVAIDGFMMLFEARTGSVAPMGNNNKFSNAVVNYSKLIMNFISKVRLFISLDITFIIVFDGIIKPPKRRVSNYSHYNCTNYEQVYPELNRIVQSGQFSENFPELQIIRQILDYLNVQYLDSPGEAEAQCSYLQKTGVVDYVISNDSDVLINGCRAVLKNLSKFKQDYGTTGKVSSSNKKDTAQEYFVTPIRMEQVESRTGFTRERLLLFAVLLGGDYHRNGVQGIGEEKAKHIVLSGTSFATEFTPGFQKFDFSQAFSKVYGVERTGAQRRQLYSHFQFLLLQELSGNMKAYFGRNYNVQSIGFNFPSDCIVMFYVKPFVLENPFKFKEQMLSFAGSHDSSVVRCSIERCLGSKVIDFFKVRRDEHLRRLGVELENVSELPLDKLEVNIKDFDSWMSESLCEALLVKVVRHSLISGSKLIRFEREKLLSYEGICADIQLIGARVASYLEFTGNETKIRTEPSPDSTSALVWVLKEMFSEDNPTIQEYEAMKEEKEAEKILKEEEKKAKAEERKRKAEERKASPKRQKTPSPKKNKAPTQQSTNLVSVGLIDESFKSPTKRSGSTMNQLSIPNLSYHSAKESDNVPSSPTNSTKLDIIDLIQTSPRIKSSKRETVTSTLADIHLFSSDDDGDLDELISIPSSSQTSPTATSNSPNRKLDFTTTPRSSPVKDKAKGKLSRTSSIRSSKPISPSKVAPTKKSMFLFPANHSTLPKNQQTTSYDPFLDDTNDLETDEDAEILSVPSRFESIVSVNSIDNPFEIPSSNENTPRKRGFELNATAGDTLHSTVQDYEVVEIISTSDEEAGEADSTIVVD
ncbi:hypothetical protein WICPIJ_000172 [Wickerhamomyces pijperi]|uniref:XPG-I domain-containing protein n=1 Tax=Wickerhamomyces pijperi TaxID=599730 RepID=A0A9P8TT69_WICPI|nr:hypothetical protein WICPIJ_000172 [Wickerhamomyces pijperi]